MQATGIRSISTDRIAARSREASEPPTLTDRRKAAWERFEHTPFSVPRGSTLSRTKLSTLDLDHLAGLALAAPGPRVTRESESPGVRVVPFAEGVRIPEVERLLFTTRLPEDGKLETLQEALPAYGTVIIVPRGVTAEVPVSIDVEVGGSGAALHTLILAEPLSKVTVVERLHGTGATEGLVTQRVEVFAMDGAHVSYASVQDLPTTFAFLSTKRADHRRDAKVVWVDTQLGAAHTKSEVTSSLNGNGSTCQNYGAFLGSGTQEFDLSARGFHNAPHTENLIFTKGALQQEARSIFFGHVHILPPGSSSSGHQKSATLLLDENARADSIPVLDVENNDVSASHGSTVGQVDREQVFYLMSRGLSRAEATRVIVQGFFEPLVSEIPVERVRDELTATIARRLAQ